MEKLYIRLLICAVVSFTLLCNCKKSINDEPAFKPVITIDNNKISAKYCDGFGSYIAISNDLVQISSEKYTFFFKYDGQNIELVQTIEGSFGRLFHDSILIFRSTEGNGDWKVSIYGRNGDIWDLKQEIKSNLNCSYFGSDIDIDGDIMAIGDGDFSYGSCGKVGEVYLYRKTSGEWIQEKKFQAEQPEPGDGFGHFVAIHNNILIVGSNMSDRIHIYKYGTDWELLRIDSTVLGALSHGGDQFMLYDSYNSQLRSFTLESDGDFNYHIINCDFDGHSVSRIGEIIEIKDSLALVATDLSDYCYFLKFENDEWSEKAVFSSGYEWCSYLGLAIADNYVVLGSWEGSGDFINGDSHVYFINF